MKPTGMPLAERVRKALSGKRAITEKKMFGGTCFLLRGHMPVRHGKQVDPGACDARALKSWIVLAESYVSALPPKGR